MSAILAVAHTFFVENLESRSSLDSLTSTVQSALDFDGQVTEYMSTDKFRERTTNAFEQSPESISAAIKRLEATWGTEFEVLKSAATYQRKWDFFEPDSFKVRLENNMPSLNETMEKAKSSHDALFGPSALYSRFESVEANMSTMLANKYTLQSELEAWQKTVNARFEEAKNDRCRSISWHHRASVKQIYFPGNVAAEEARQKLVAKSGVKLDLSNACGQWFAFGYRKTFHNDLVNDAVRDLLSSLEIDEISHPYALTIRKNDFYSPSATANEDSDIPREDDIGDLFKQ
ncbi:MAG: hypothetical protein AAF986_10310 [Pseudomonadota bacterium]